MNNSPSNPHSHPFPTFSTSKYSKLSNLLHVQSPFLLRYWRAALHFTAVQRMQLRAKTKRQTEKVTWGNGGRWWYNGDKWWFYQNNNLINWWYTYPSGKISQMGLLFPVYGHMKNVPNHQPAMGAVIGDEWFLMFFPPMLPWLKQMVMNNV